MKHTKLLPLVAALTLVLLSGGCKFVTVVQLEETGKQQFYYEDKDFDANAYASDVWPQIVQYCGDNAAPLKDVLTLLAKDPAACGEQYGYRPQSEGASYNYVVKGSAKVLSADTASKAGKLLFDLAPFDGEADFTMQIGPVFRGNSVRDAMPFISFENFRNQLTFGDVGKAINTYIGENIIDREALTAHIGKEITFTGAFSESVDILIMPIQIQLEG